MAGEMALQHATAALGATVGLGFAGPLIANVPFLNTPAGAMIGGLGIAWVGFQFFTGHMEALTIGVGVGLAARGLIALAFPEGTIRATA